MKRFGVSRIPTHGDTKTLLIQAGEYDRNREKNWKFFFFLNGSVIQSLSGCSVEH